jgi:hypothetical protein
MRENWKPIKGYEEVYEISSHGRVRRILSRTSGKAGHIMVGGLTHGYRSITLTKDGSSKGYTVHRLVAQHFLNPSKKANAQVNHKDGNKLNNIVDNLEWVTPLENNQHSTKYKLRPRGEQHGQHKLTEEQIQDILLNYGKDGISYRTLAKKHGVSHTMIEVIVKRIYWTHVEIP